MNNIEDTQDDRIELSREENDSMLTAVEMIIETIRSKASQYLIQIEETAKHDGKTLEEIMELIASQKDWDGKSYGGDYASGKYLGFAGGFQGSVFSNLMYELGIGVLGDSPHMKDTTPFRMVASLALKKAMAEDAELKKLVEAVASATKIVGGEKEYAPFKLVLESK